MLNTRMKRLTYCGVRAVERLGEIETSITGLADNDLLDLADIFKAEPRTPIGDMVLLPPKGGTLVGPTVVNAIGVAAT